MFPLARSSVPMTPSMTSLMFRTPSSSRRSWASRTSSASNGSFSFWLEGVGVLGVFGLSWNSIGLMGEKTSERSRLLWAISMISSNLPRQYADNSQQSLRPRILCGSDSVWR